jgi:DinB superfamily
VIYEDREKGDLENWRLVEELEKNEILRMLTEGDAALRAALSGISNPQATQRPIEGGWSMLDCVEHVAVTERALLDGVRNATPADGSQHNPVREAKILDRALDRARFIAAPDAVVPAGRLATLAEALVAFEAARAETIRCVEGFEGDPRSWITPHPLVRTPVNCYEMFLMIALHPKRHAQQIALTRAVVAAGRPGGEQTVT